MFEDRNDKKVSTIADDDDDDDEGALSAAIKGNELNV
jgi:hypothetical protein